MFRQKQRQRQRQTPNQHIYTNNISVIYNLDKLIQQYPNQRVIPQFKKLKQNYPYYRAICGDGNCFYRAIAFLYLRQADLSRFESVFVDIDNLCTQTFIQFEHISFSQYLYKIFEENLKVISKKSKLQRQSRLVQLFNTLVFDQIMIIYFRSLNYLEIKKNYKKYQSFFNQNQSYERILKFGHDSEGVEYLSMANVLGVFLKIHVTDQQNLKQQKYGEYYGFKCYQLFFRPGHFDVLYHKDSEYVKGNKNNVNTNGMMNKNSLNRYNQYQQQRNIDQQLFKNKSSYNDNDDNPFAQRHSYQHQYQNQQSKQYNKNLNLRNSLQKSKQYQHSNQDYYLQKKSQKMGYDTRQNNNNKLIHRQSIINNNKKNNFNRNSYKQKQQQQKQQQQKSLLLGMNSNDKYLNNLRMNSLNSIDQMKKQNEKQRNKNKEKQRQEIFKLKQKEQKTIKKSKGSMGLRKDDNFFKKKQISQQKQFKQQQPSTSQQPQQQKLFSSSIKLSGTDSFISSMKRAQNKQKIASYQSQTNKINQQKWAIEKDYFTGYGQRDSSNFNKFKQYSILAFIVAVIFYAAFG